MVSFNAASYYSIFIHTNAADRRITKYQSELNGNRKAETVNRKYLPSQA